MPAISPHKLGRLLKSEYLVGALIGLIALLVFWLSPVRQINDSRYSMLVSQSLIEYGSFTLDNYALPRLAPVQREDYVANGDLYQLEWVDNHLYYFPPPGSSVLSVPFVALMKMIGMTATNADKSFSLQGEERIEGSIAALLMALLSVVFYYLARLLLPVSYSVIVAAGGALGTQIWSTASRAMYTDTWAVLLLTMVVWMLTAHELKKHSIKPVLMASLMSWMYFVYPLYSIHIMAVSAYIFIFHRRLFVPYALTGAAWLAGFIAYSWHHFHQLLPNYFKGSRLNFENFWIALPGNLISPSRGLLVYVPLIFFIAYLLLRYRRELRLRRLVVLALAISGLQLLVVSSFAHWWGGHSFGPRFTTALVPWMVLLGTLGLNAMLSRRRQRKQEEGQTAATVTPASRRALHLEWLPGLLLLILSIFIHGRGALYFETTAWNSRPSNIDKHPERVWDWRQPQFLAGLLPPPLPEEFPLMESHVDFSTSEAEKFLWYGWSGREETSRWSDGTEATFIFALEKIDDLMLRIKLGAFLPRGKENAQQRVFIKLNDQDIGNLLIKDEGAREYELKLDKNLLRQRNVITFILPDAASPRSLGLSDDGRLLGVAVNWIELKPLSRPQEN